MSTNVKGYYGDDVEINSPPQAGREGIVSAQSGPTFQDGLPAFQWSTSSWASEMHLGQPDAFNFGFVDMHFKP